MKMKLIKQMSGVLKFIPQFISDNDSNVSECNKTYFNELYLS